MEKKRIINKTELETAKKTMLIPEIKIKSDQIKKINNVCPISGWAANNIAIISVIKKDNKYLR